MQACLHCPGIASKCRISERLNWLSLVREQIPTIRGNSWLSNRIDYYLSLDHCLSEQLGFQRQASNS
ncbi:hypothetical protein A6A04_10645 [Paramagnetospirillum marisnigri]|uniref:Uncharacterized protein n=1 Tax=Paramagnetospirillum marisnigri TaxID=1285242 RepID=A0A178MXA3_9PROT|nr:hypothetical protein [Paramagnetospirillum marisnigri]OAN56008.1 hypothetical protein A6A04_10645 [Paramagnetospirillum marisnigri]